MDNYRRQKDFLSKGIHEQWIAFLCMDKRAFCLQFECQHQALWFPKIGIAMFSHMIRSVYMDRERFSLKKKKLDFPTLKLFTSVRFNCTKAPYLVEIRRLVLGIILKLQRVFSASLIEIFPNLAHGSKIMFSGRK